MKLAKNQQSGSLHQYVKKVTGENGEIAEYPKVVGARDRGNINHWHYQLTWKVKIDGKWRTQCRSVPRNKVESIERILRDGGGLVVAIEKLKSSGQSVCDRFFHVIYMEETIYLYSFVRLVNRLIDSSRI